MMVFAPLTRAGRRSTSAPGVRPRHRAARTAWPRHPCSR